MTGAADETIIVARVVLPVRDSTEVLPLYLDGEVSRDDSGGFVADGVRILSRRSVWLTPGRTASFGSYFNHFPAAYWRRHTNVRSVTLTVRTSGTGLVRVLRSDGAGETFIVAEAPAEADTRFDLPLDDVAGGGTFWFDLIASGDGLELTHAEWSVSAATLPRDAGTATVGMATHNRPDDCIAQLEALGADANVLSALDRIVVVDQGEVTVNSRPEFAAVAERLGEKLVLIRQRNLGGSGGFSRGMYETLERRESGYTLLLDDDAISEPEAVLRAIRFADATQAAGRPVVVGGGMLHLDDRTRMYAQSEQWNTRIGWVDLARLDAYDHDFAEAPFRQSAAWHRIRGADFNGWWFCLIPVELLRSHGLALPLFLKGDDAEFGRRAAGAGYPTVSLPGVAVWHLGWGGKAPTRTWEAYFLHRNRLIGELLHARSRRPTVIVLHSFLGDAKPLLLLQYSAVRLRAEALQDVFAGPGTLPGMLETRVGEIRALWGRYPDAAPVNPAAIRTAGRRPGRLPVGRAARLLLLARVCIRHLMIPAAPASRAEPEAFVAADELSWATFARLDSALVETADGRSVTWYQRSRSASARALARSVTVHVRLWWSWPRLAARYRRASAELTSAGAWRAVFGDHA